MKVRNLIFNEEKTIIKSLRVDFDNLSVVEVFEFLEGYKKLMYPNNPNINHSFKFQSGNEKSIVGFTIDMNDNNDTKYSLNITSKNCNIVYVKTDKSMFTTQNIRVLNDEEMKIYFKEV